MNWVDLLDLCHIGNIKSFTRAENVSRKVDFSTGGNMYVNKLILQSVTGTKVAKKHITKM